MSSRTLLSPAYEVQAVNTAKIVPRSPAAGSGLTRSICAHRAATGEGLVAVAAGSWRMCSNSTPYCHPVEYFTGHQHEDIFTAIYLLGQCSATQEKPCGLLGSSTLCVVKLHLFPKMGEPERKGWTRAPA